MTERFTYDSKTVSILKDGEFWLDGQIDTACNHSEICNELNALNDENEQLRQQVQKIHKLINSKIQSARELGSVKTVIALKNLQRELNSDVE